MIVNGKPVDAVDNNIFFGAVLALGLRAECFAIGGPRLNDSFKVGEEIFLVEARDSDKSCAGDLLSLKWAHNNHCNWTLCWIRSPSMAIIFAIPTHRIGR